MNSAITQALDALRRYGGHSAFCRTGFSDLPCDCGLGAAITALEAALGWEPRYTVEEVLGAFDGSAGLPHIAWSTPLDKNPHCIAEVKRRLAAERKEKG